MTQLDTYELPSEWEWVRLGNHVIKIGSGVTPRGGESVYQNAGIPLIRSQNVHMQSFSREGLVYISSSEDENMAQSRVMQNDVLLNITGASIGRACLVPDEVCPANVNQHVSIIRCDASINPRFLVAYLASNHVQRYIMGSQAGATRQALTKSMIEDFMVPLPPPAEQKRIVAILTQKLAAIDKARAAAQAQLTAAQALPPAYLRQIFEGEEAQEWRREPLGNLVLSFKNGYGRRPDGAEEGPIVLRIADVSSGQIDLNNPRKVSMSEDEIEMYKVDKGDALFVRVNGSAHIVGRCVAVNKHYDELIYNDHLIRAQLTPTLDVDYLKLVCDTTDVRRYIVEQASTSAGQLTVNQSILSEIQVPCIELHEQQRIVAGYGRILQQTRTLIESITNHWTFEKVEKRQVES